MKKLLLISVGLVMACLTQAQPVSDNAVIPMSVTLNSILRLTVITGGNIEFVVTTIDQYTNGILNSAKYDTHFTVASSNDFDVDMTVEDGAFMGQDNPANTLALNNVQFELNAGAVATPWVILGKDVLKATQKIVDGVAGLSAGSATQNDFIIHWELGTVAGNSLLSQSLKPDHYSTNIYLQLTGK